MRNGVYSIDELHSHHYGLPSSFVEAFRMIVVLLLETMQALERMTVSLDTLSGAAWTSEDERRANSVYYHLKSLGRSLNMEIDNGKNDILAMISIQEHSKVIKRTLEVGADYVLATLLSNLHLGVDCQDLLDVYKKYTERLVRGLLACNSHD